MRKQFEIQYLSVSIKLQRNLEMNLLLVPSLRAMFTKVAILRADLLKIVLVLFSTLSIHSFEKGRPREETNAKTEPPTRKSSSKSASKCHKFKVNHHDFKQASTEEGEDKKLEFQESFPTNLRIFLAGDEIEKSINSSNTSSKSLRFIFPHQCSSLPPKS